MEYLFLQYLQFVSLSFIIMIEGVKKRKSDAGLPVNWFSIACPKIIRISPDKENTSLPGFLGDKTE